MTQNNTGLPTYLLTAAKSKLVVLSILALSSATAFAWGSNASGCNPLNNACTSNVSDQVVQKSGSEFDPLLLLEAVSPSKEGNGVVVDFCLLRNAINTISPQFRHRVLEIMYLPMQIQDKNGYLNVVQYNDLIAALNNVR